MMRVLEFFRTWLASAIVIVCLGIVTAGFFADGYEGLPDKWRMFMAAGGLVVAGILLFFSRMAAAVILAIILVLLATNVLLLWPYVVSQSFEVGFGDTGISTPSLRWPYVFVALMHGFVYFYHLGKEE